jgi:serine/threonine-protein kinase
MTMELLEGKNLAELLEERGPLPIQDACAYAVQACEALVEAHRQGIVHRDIKPANLFLAQGTAGSSIKVIDFGIAKELDSSERQTSTRMVMGSVAHMPPEQLKAAKYAEPRSDIWAIGSTLFELLTGQRPFQAPSLPQLIVTIHCDPPRSVTALRPEIPPGLVHVLLRCLEKKPEQRYPSVADLAAALRPFVTGEAALAEPPNALSTEPSAAPVPAKAAPATAKAALASSAPAKGASAAPASSVSEKRIAASSAPAAMSARDLVVPGVVFGVLVAVGLLALALLRTS